MEKSSEKVIGSNKLSPNPFNNLLSEVQIKISQPKSTKKIDNYALEMDSNIDKSNSNYVPESTHQSKKDGHSETQSKIIHQNVYVINAPLKTKHSSDTVSKQKSQKDIINEWVIGFMGKRHLLGLHWQENLKEKYQQLMKIAFDKIKQGKQQNSMECNSYSDKIIRFINMYHLIEADRISQCFHALKDFYKDDLLFGLSNTLGEERDHSLMLKMDSDCQSLSLQSKNFKKQGQKLMHQYSFSESQSNKNLTKKQSSSGSASEDLSNLILNHNKLRLQDELNRSVPNIPKDKASQRSIKTNKQIGELCMQTKKQINTQKKLGEDTKFEGLPLQSKANLIHTKKQLSNENQTKTKDKGQEDKIPVTITFILNDMNTISLMKPQNKAEISQGQSKIQPRKSNQGIAPNNHFLDQNGINGLPFTESFYQNAVIKSKPMQAIQNIDNQKRSTSLQIKPGYEPLFPQRHQEPTRNSSRKPIFLNQYYPEQCGRENIRFSKEGVPLNMGERVRPKSATPKITFTFTSSNAASSNIKSPTQSKVTNHPINNVFVPFEHHDYIVQSVLHPHNNAEKPVIGVQRHKNRLQVVSPSRYTESSKKWVPPNKLAFDNREHIRNNLLPPLSFNDYYGAQNGQKSLKSQKSGGQVVFMENQVIYSDPIKNSTVNNSIFGCSPRESSLNLQSKQPIRMKSPKDKIFVTYANPCQF